jgi:acyl-CoA synthetase (AMP-forming)/AMP-acid ligase II
MHSVEMRMKHLSSKMGWEIVEEEWSDFKGRIFKNRPKNLIQMLENTVSQSSNLIGFICNDQKLTFGEFNQIVNRIAAGLQKYHVKKGDRVSLLLGIGLEFPLCFFALMKLGAIAVPLNTRFKGEELFYEINDSGSKMLIVDQEYWPSIEAVQNDLKTVEKIFFNGPDLPKGVLPFVELRENQGGTFQRIVLNETDDAIIMYTSGTTGKPKGAILYHRSLIATAMHISDFFAYEPEDRVICVVPLFHITGLAQIMLSHIFSGIPCVYVRTFKVKDVLEIMSSERITRSISVINILWLMINHPEFDHYDFSSYKGAMCGGSPATEEMVKGILNKLPHLKLSIGYGLTESDGIASTTPYEEALRKIEAAGKILPLVDAKIVDGEGKELPPNSVGEIVLRGPTVTKGYWGKPEATKATIADSWLHTGDIGKLDDEGYIYILDRKKDMINRGGEKIFSLEVENVISRNSKVLEVAVVAVPDKFLGEAVKAAIVLRPGQTADEEEIKNFCSQHLADYKVPKYVEFLDLLPRNPAGKIMKGDLRYIKE